MEKETIELVKKMIEDGNLSQEIAEKYCPELKESKDERIRKWLICTLKSLNNSPVQIDGAYEMMLPAIAWLEERGEQKSIPIFKIGETIIAKDGTSIIKEPFHIDKIENDYYWDGENTILICNQDEFELVEQKNAWSEEDIKMFANIKACLRNANKDYSREVDWLMSLKPQPKQEWSEEDERIRIETIELLETANHPNVLHRNGKPLDFTENINWLKSIRPQKPLTNEEIEQAKKEYRDMALSKMDYIPEELTYDDGWDDAISYMKKSLRPQTSLEAS